MQTLTSFRSRASIVASLLFTVSFLIPSDSHAQVPSSWGQEFWVVFMANAGGGGSNEAPDLRLYLNSSLPTSVRVADNSTGRVKAIELHGSYQEVEVDITALFGDEIVLDSVDQGISNKTLSISCNRAISVHGANVKIFSADAFLGLPREALGNRYILLGYQNGYNSASVPGESYDMSSQFAIVGVEDGTRVTINPSTTINGQSTEESISFKLDHNQVYFAQAGLETENDITGTEVVSDKPVAVFSSNERTSVPTNVGNFRDHLVEQMIPVEFWQDTFLISPFPIITPEVPYPPVARVVGAFDGTELTERSHSRTKTTWLSSGEVYELEVGSSVMLTASQPVLVAYYEHSVGNNTQGTGQFGLGDPFMTLIPSPKQYQSFYSFSSIPHPEFTEHYVTAIVPTKQVANLFIDGQPVPQSTDFFPIAGTDFLYATISVSEGSHFASIEAGLDEDDVEFGLIVFGYGQAVSYGYPAGMRFPKRPSGVDEERELLSQTSFIVQPQPISTDEGLLEVQLPSASRLSFTLYDVEGTLVKSLGSDIPFEEGESKYRMNLQGVNSGVYYCVVTGEHGNSVERSLIIQR